jgi:PPOX class probable F420-dependent enzyme
MPTSDRIPEDFLDLFARPVLAHLATIMPDGSPQVTPVWIGYEDGLLLVNTIRGRVKDRNLHPGARVALDMVDPDDPFRYLAVRGEVVEATEEGAAASIDALALRYLGRPTRATTLPGRASSSRSGQRAWSTRSASAKSAERGNARRHASVVDGGRHRSALPAISTFRVPRSYFV